MTKWTLFMPSPLLGISMELVVFHRTVVQWRSFFAPLLWYLDGIGNISQNSSLMSARSATALASIIWFAEDRAVGSVIGTLGPGSRMFVVRTYYF